MELRHLRCFVAVAEELHFTRAAERCHTVQSALSHQISRLEEQLGARLFERTSRRVALTPAGDAWFPPFSEAEWRLVSADEHAAVEAQPAHAYQLWQRR